MNEKQLSPTTFISEKATEFERWQNYQTIEREIIEKFGIEIWDEFPPVSMEFLIKVRIEQKKRKTNHYEKRVLRRLKDFGLFPEYQCVLLNRRVSDFAFLSEKLILEIDDSSHFSAIEKDQAKDLFAEKLGFMTLRLKHPFSEDELTDFSKKVEFAFVARGGRLFDYPEKTVYKIRTPKKEPVEYLRPNALRSWLKQIIHGVRNAASRRKKEYRRLVKMNLENQRKALFEIEEEFKKSPITADIVPKKEISKVILRKKSGERRIVPFDSTGELEWTTKVSNE